jgi:hypothetical protein
MPALWLLAASLAFAAEPSPVTAALLELLGPERAATLRRPAELEPVALAFRAEERPAAKAALARLEGAGDASLRPEIARAYVLIGDADSAARLQPSLSAPDAEVQRALALARSGDHEAAYAEAVMLNQRYPGRTDVASLLAATRGRGRISPGATDSGVTPAGTGTTEAAASKNVAFTEAPRRRAFADAPPDIILTAETDQAPERGRDGRAPLWPMLPIGLLSAGGYAVARRNKTFEAHDEAEDAPPPSPTDRLLAGAVVAGFAGAALYYGGAVAAPALIRAMSSGGQQAMRLAASETGAINPAVNLAQRSPTLNNLNLQLTAQQISRGHAFAKHGAQFGVRTPDEFARIIERAISNPTMVRNLSRGRVAYWHQSSATVVIRDPAAVDGGTAFIPSRGLEYFNSLR